MSGSPITAIAFDIYGTLCEIREPCNPYGQLFESLGIDRRAGARAAMTTDCDIPTLAAQLAPGAACDLAPIEAGVRVEAASVALFPDVPEALAALRARGLRLAVISNLAPPYGPPVRRLLAPWIDTCIFSFEVGHAKPDGAIFQLACERLGIAPARALMVGDNPKHDVAGAQAAGIQALQIQRAPQPGREGASGQRIATLAELIAIIDVL